MKNSVALVFIIVSYVSLPVYSSCQSDMVKVNGFAKKAQAAKKQGDSKKASLQYKRAARKLSSMKYTCSKISLKTLLSKEKYYRKLASGTAKNSSQERNIETIKNKTNSTASASKSLRRCNSKLLRAKKLITQGRTARRSKRKTHYAAARELLWWIKRKCPGSNAASSAKKLLSRIKATRSGVRSSSKKIKNSTRNTPKRKKNAGTLIGNRATSYNQRQQAPKSVKNPNNRLIRQHAKSNSCETKKLGHIYSAEKQAYSALNRTKYMLAASRFIDAIHGYENSSHKCTSDEGKLAVLERVDQLRMILDNIKKDHIHCGKRLKEVQNISQTAYDAEQSEQFKRAQEGYVKAVIAFQTMPQVCASNTHTIELNENRDKRDLLACSHYVAGIKDYNIAFSLVRKAQKNNAVKAYRKAISLFTLGLKKCSLNTSNNNVVRRLNVKSARSIKRMLGR
ncbi:hypothetical protein MNBD_GAMMA12-3121 [hydrothermal vent metagenome]|uniref:Uncharacterized protein n=1 Tax=hydrothermal vent metagenome TaxID=652676 RepID=A0A3B0Y202_9ZZZZ